MWFWMIILGLIQYSVTKRRGEPKTWALKIGLALFALEVILFMNAF